MVYDFTRREFVFFFQSLKSENPIFAETRSVFKPILFLLKNHI